MHHKIWPSAFDEYGLVLHNKIFLTRLLFSAFVFAGPAGFPSTFSSPSIGMSLFVEPQAFEQILTSTICGGILSNDCSFFLWRAI